MVIAWASLPFFANQAGTGQHIAPLVITAKLHIAAIMLVELFALGFVCHLSNQDAGLQLFINFRVSFPLKIENGQIRNESYLAIAVHPATEVPCKVHLHRPILIMDYSGK